MKRIIREHFKSIHQMLDVIERRPNNEPMTGTRSSINGDQYFTGTKNWDHAIRLFEFGYTEILDQVKKGINQNMTKTTPMTRRRIQTGVQGYAPHVPNAIMGLPNSMIRTESEIQKTKTVSIVYAITENAGTEADEFIKSGIAILSVINTLELNGYRVNLDIAFYTASECEEYALGTVNVKDYREHLDIQKLCFPIANPSMFRRLGFKWIETVPDLKESGWCEGYGRQVNWKDFPKQAMDDKNHYLGLHMTRNCKYDPDKIIKTMNLKEITL